MSRDALTLSEYVDHVITAIGRIARYTDALNEAAFSDDELVQDAVVRNIEVIGEACRNIRRYFPAFVTQHPEVPFQSAYEMRNALTHGYHKIDFGVVWVTVREDLPALGKQFESLAIELKSAS
ncbi:DUF86 domain-containing protein [Caballeronia sp. LZ029]|uniref:HepT-like ribonuclease domain-containing protein n=1 Tax=Caballeronia sp. LZ029 TaxID=3038564 RepID=UPI00285FDB75|nr:DUF86 domain-containing protein [Caballeronia sp. LZ029]MDR5745391.1 DUF86 domain-containing protein [Caballeronia sp. LZ029]